jgi:hypothetical protein
MAWQAIAAQLAVRTGLWLFSLTRGDDKKKQPRPRPEAIDFPLTQVGAPVPIVYGTVRIDAPLLVWFGNESVNLNTSINQNVYRADMLFVLGVPPSTIAGSIEVPSVRRFFYADIETDGSSFGGGLSHGNQLVVNGTISDDAVFCAVIEFYDGRSDQEITNYPSAAVAQLDKQMRDVAGIDGGEIPGYRHQMLLAVLATNSVITAGRLGTTPQVKQIGAEVRARGYSPMVTGFYDANPAWVLYDLICGEVFKIGYPTSRVDRDSFEACATILQNEEHGCSVAILDTTKAREAIAGLLDQIDGQIIEIAPDGGGPPVLRMSLIRAVEPEDIEDILDEDNMLRGPLAPKIQIINWATTANQVDVMFTDRSAGYKQNVATAERLANAIGQDGRPRRRRVDFPFCMNATLAAKLAARELSVAARPLITMTANVTRELAHLVPGDVVLVQRPDLNLDGLQFRVLDVDLGQPVASHVKLTLVEDVFDNSLGGNENEVDPPQPYLLPLHERLVTEAPAWFQQRLYDAGTLYATSSDPLGYALALAANDDDTLATSMKGRGSDLFNPLLLSDDRITSSEFLKTATLANDYSRTAEPYDTSTGLSLTGCSAQLQVELDALGATEWSDSLLGTYGYTLCVLYDPSTGEHEFIQYKRQSGTGATRTLSYVWRGLLDTPARDWPAGTRLVQIGAGYGDTVVRAPRFEGDEVREQLVPLGSALIGSGDDPIDSVTIEMRQANPMPVTDLVLASPDSTGTLGQPPITKSYKAISLLDGHISNVFANKQSRLEAQIVRGDSAGAAAAPETYSLLAQKPGDDDAVEVELFTALSNPGDANYFGLGKVGSGSINVSMRTTDGDGRTSWNDPTIRVEAPDWRNLLVNSRGLASTSTSPSMLGWTNVTGTAQSSQGTSSPSKSTTGTYFTSATASGGVTEFRQVVDVRGFKPAGMTAILEFYYRNFSDADDTTTILVEALASDGTTQLDSSSAGPLVGHQDLWTRHFCDLSLPDGTTYVRATITLTAAGGGDTTPSSACAEPTLILGQMTDQLLENPTFDEAIEYLLSVRIDGEPETIEENQNIAVEVEVEVGGDTQSNLILALTITYETEYETAPDPTHVDLDGWTQTSAWMISAGIFSATFERASLGVGAPASTLLFAVNSRGPGTVTLEASVTSDEVVGSSTDLDEVTVIAAGAAAKALLLGGTT